MVVSRQPSTHTFHIPVMGTGFTIDTPLRVARYGISSAISMVDDVLMEQMRRVHAVREGEPYEEIGDQDPDPRASRITAYLNLMDRLVRRQVEELQASPFEAGSEITRYFEMLPRSPLKDAYNQMLSAVDPVDVERRQQALRPQAVSGGVDVNIMTKVSRASSGSGDGRPPEFDDVMSCLRGYARSTLRSSVIFSAGMNPALYAYVSEFDDFFPDESGQVKKRIVLKVSDYRSAVIQGKYLAKRGLWVAEYRIESGLNCGGHAFATKGYLMGPVLEEFKRNREQLAEELHSVRTKALARLGRLPDRESPVIRITVQGGISTSGENEYLLEHYELDGTGWATPFLLVPEVTNVDDLHLEKLSAASDADVYLSEGSPLGTPIWNLRHSASDTARLDRIQEGRPGSPCPKGLLRINSEFTENPICTASRAYQKRKLEHLPEEGLSPEQMDIIRQVVIGKACICHDLGGSALLKNNIDLDAAPLICTGPNIAYFSKVSTLEEMVGHIYGRESIVSESRRPHMFIRELELYVEHLREEGKRFLVGLSARSSKYFREFRENLLAGIAYYRQLAEQLGPEDAGKRVLADLEVQRLAIAQLSPS